VTLLRFLTQLSFTAGLGCGLLLGVSMYTRGFWSDITAVLSILFALAWFAVFLHDWRKALRGEERR